MAKGISGCKCPCPDRGWCVPSYHRPHLKNPVGNVDKRRGSSSQFLSGFFFFPLCVLFSCNSYFKCQNQLTKHTYLPRLCQHASVDQHALVAVCAWDVMSTQAGPKRSLVLPPQPQAMGSRRDLGITGLLIPNCRKSLLKS